MEKYITTIFKTDVQKIELKFLTNCAFVEGTECGGGGV
jgi:hypothetical protein